MSRPDRSGVGAAFMRPAKIAKFLIAILSVAYIFVLLSLCTANFCYNQSTLFKQEGMPFDKAYSYINLAIRLNPLKSEYHYQKYLLLNDKEQNAKGLNRKEKLGLLDETLTDIRKAIDLEPSNASYHMYYGLSLIKRYPRRGGKISVLINEELGKSRALKPMSSQYKETFTKYKK